MRRQLPFTLLLAAGLAVTLARGGAELLLQSGERLVGVELERKQEQYLLTLKNGAVVAVPLPLVREIRLTGDDDPAPTGLEPAEARTLVGPPAGPELRQPARQLEVFGESRPFPRDIVDPIWRPAGDWAADPDGNDFHPVRWYEPPIDPLWKPRSAFGRSRDVTQFNPVRWYRSPIDSVWRPRDGFDRNSVRFPDRTRDENP